MPTPTFEPLANITLGDAVSSLTFSGINQSYRDLVLLINYFGSGAMVQVRFNGDTSGSYTNVVLGGNGSSAYSYSDGAMAGIRMAVNTSTSTSCNIFLNVMDYAVTNKHKSIIARNGRVDNADAGVSGRWSNFSAITSMTLSAETNSFAVGSTFSLYGIAG